MLRARSCNRRSQGARPQRLRAQCVRCPAGFGVVYAVSAGIGHDWPAHTEYQGRVTAALEGLSRHAVDSYSVSSIRELKNVVPASADTVKLVHAPSYVDKLRDVVQRFAPTILEESGPTYVTAASYDIVLQSVGAATALVDEVCTQRAQGARPDAAFGLVRPPGHHAVPASPMGFCIFGTAAVAARWAQCKHGLSRILIYDFDVHHGNGTADAFESDPSVLFISSHQTGLYPGTGKAERTGRGDGEGFSININLPGDAGDGAYRAVWEEIAAPAITRFEPELILVSAGYDGHWRDPIGGLQMRTSTYHWLCQQLQEQAEALGAGIVFLLEGGYDSKALGDAVADSFRGLMDMPSIDTYNAQLLREEPMDKVYNQLRYVKAIHGL